MNENIVNKLLITAITTVLLLTGVSPLFAQSSEWAVKMFSELGTERLHNFGSVALHADVEKRFPFKNIYNEDVVISSTSSNCGCTKASVSKQVIHPGEIGEVIARVDTSGREHTKQRKATIRVVFSKPLQAEVQLQVKTYIRPDVGFDPGIWDSSTWNPSFKKSISSICGTFRLGAYRGSEERARRQSRSARSASSKRKRRL